MKYCPVCARSLDNSRTLCPFDEVELLDSDPMIGRVAGTKYAILSRLGRGGMGVVYKARHVFMDRFVALKVIHPKLTRDRRYVNMLRQEALVAAKFTHPNAVALHDFGFMEDDATFYMVMEYLRGRNLRRTIRHLGRLLPKRALRIVRQVIMAVAASHREGIVHLDMKPENIMLVRRSDGSDLVKVLDFGIARFINTSGDNIKKHRMSLEARAKKVLGTVKYMSPEQIYDLQIDARSDIYSIGVVLYEILAGEHPFPANTKVEIMRKHLHGKPRPLRKMSGLRIPKELEQSVMKALEKKPENRYQSAEEFAEDLRLADVAILKSEETSETTGMPASLGSHVRRFFASKHGTERAGRAAGQPAVEGMVMVPAGQFRFGSGLASDEKPEHVTFTEGFLIDVYLGTNDDYKKFVDATGHEPPGHWKTVSYPPGMGRHPVVEITWYDAEAYARWVGKRLPTEREWEKAARGTGRGVWPWGSRFDPTKCNWGENLYRNNGVPGTSPVGVFEGDCSPYRCFDMAGNVLEWTSDWYDRYYLGTSQNPDFGKKYKVLRGGSWQSMSKGYLRSSKRSRALPDSRGQYGFRCVIGIKDLPAYESRLKEPKGPRT